MRHFQRARAKGEALLNQSKIPASFIRPWYVLGAGHWWPILLKPAYSIAKLIPSKKEAAQKLEIVTISQMIKTLAFSIRSQPLENRYYEVSDMKRF